MFLSKSHVSMTQDENFTDKEEIFQRAALPIFQKADSATIKCKRNIEMTPLCKIEVTLPRVLGSREVCLGGVVDEQTGVQPA